MCVLADFGSILHFVFFILKWTGNASATNRTKLDATIDDDSKYAMWTPPEDQSGDGKTSLNRKYGY